MKGLLHSKKFRSNLYKWLFMYVGVMGLLTTVVTYSRYISNFDIGDEARATKFNVDIKQEGEYVGENIPTYRPTSKIPYYFIVNTDVEVNTYLVLSFIINGEDHFRILSIDAEDIISTDEAGNNTYGTPYNICTYDLDKNNYVFNSDTSYESVKSESSNGTNFNLELGTRVGAATNKKIRFKVTVDYYNEKYIKTNSKGEKYFDMGNDKITLKNDYVVKVGYSATQE